MRSYEIAPSNAVERARHLRQTSTATETILWRALRERLPQHKWRRQMPVGPYIVDVACFATKLVIEVDGGRHAGQADRDAARTQFLERHGYRVLRFWNDDVTGNLDGVLDRVAGFMAKIAS